MDIVRGKTWLYFRLPDGTTGCRLWSTPSATDIGDLLEIAERALGTDPHGAVVDATYVAGYAPDAFAALWRFVRERGDELRRVVTRMAVVRSESPLGAMAAGFFDVQPAAFSTKTHASLADALRWVGASDVEQTVAALDGALEQAMHSGTIVHAVRAFVERDLESPRAKDCARSLGLSERSLQRLLAEHEVSFRDIVTTARVEHAKRLLAQTDTAISRIAQASGFSAVGAFSTAFRRATGLSPSAFRREATERR